MQKKQRHKMPVDTFLGNGLMFDTYRKMEKRGGGKMDLPRAFILNSKS